MLLGNKFVLTQVLEALFPRYCVNCGQEGSLLCATCRLSWEHTPPDKIDHHLAVYAYANPTVRKLLTTWKYTYDQSAWEILKTEAEDFLPEIQRFITDNHIQALLPLPLSEHRLRERGFNQSEMIAKWLSEKFHLPVIDALTREHRRGHQADKEVDERKAAMQDSPFHLKTGLQIPERILLVDDVYTTGATLEAAKQSFNLSQESQVFTFTLAQG